MSDTDTTEAGSSYLAMPLHELRDSIRSENTKARSAARKSLEHVRNCGQMLIQLKSKVDHGNWIHELKNLRIERRTASNYMLVASKWETVSHLNHGVKDALKLLSSLDDAPRPKSASVAPAGAEIVRFPSGPSRAEAPQLVIDAEIVEPEAQEPPEAIDDAPEPLVVDGTHTRIHHDPVDPSEPLLIAIKEGMPEVEPEPIFHAVERLIYALIHRKCDASYITSLADAVFAIENRK